MVSENIWNMSYNGVTVLLTAIGSFSADCVVSSLKRSGCRVVGCDIYPPEWHPVSMDLEKVYKVPLALDSDYPSVILDICIKESVNHIFPLTDLEIDVLRNYRDLFESNSINLCIQSEACLDIARDKYRQFCYFNEDPVVNVPHGVLAEEVTTDMQLPLIAKPVNGRSSEGLLRLASQDELDRMSGRSGYLIQETIPGNVFTVDYVRDAQGNDFAVPREELLRTKNGAGTTVRLVPDPRIQKLASHIGERLGVVGCINMEFIYDGNDYYLIDINPRFSAGVAFSNMAGYDMVQSHLNCFIGKNCLPPVDFDEQIVAKRYIEVKL